MVVNGKSAAAFGIAPGLVCVLLVASQAGCAGASSSVHEAPATAGSQGVSSSKLQAVLEAGIVLGSNDGPAGASLRGLRFSVSVRAKTFDGAIVHVWGSATHAAVLDTWLNGHGVVDAGLVVRQPEGFVARRLVASSFRSYGVLVDPNQEDYRARAPYVL